LLRLTGGKKLVVIRFGGKNFCDKNFWRQELEEQSCVSSIMSVNHLRSGVPASILACECLL
jgi:hypothetical protein